MMEKKSSSHRTPPVTLVVVYLVIFLMGVLTASGSPARKTSGTTSELGTNLAGGIGERTSRKIVAENKDVQLSCPIFHGTPHQVEWYKQNPGGRGKKRITQFRNRYELSNGEMKIHPLTPEDSGTYVCKVSNKSELHFIQLVVSGDQTIQNNHLKLSQNRKGSNAEPYSEPQIAKNLLPKQKIYHATKGIPILLLQCESSGNPKPTITWYKNGGMISSLTTNVSTLKLLKVSSADSGQYKCESVNLFGISRYEVTLQVTDYGFGSSEILELSPRNVTLKEGSYMNISCVARFEMDPWFSWVRKVASNKTESGKVFFHSGTSSYYEVLKSTVGKPRGEGGIYSTDLIIPNVTKNDSGVYYCAVAGLQGYNLSDATITVEPDPLQFFPANVKGVAAQWAVLWTISFIFLVMLVVLCFINLYGCRPQKPSTKPVPSSSSSLGNKKSKSQHCNLPESSPLTMSTQCTTQESFLPLMVGGGDSGVGGGCGGGGGAGSGSCSGISSRGDPFDSDYDQDYDYSPSASCSNVLIYQHQHQHNHSHFPASSWAVSSRSSGSAKSGYDGFGSRSYRPNSMCSDYQQCNQQCNQSSVSQKPASSSTLGRGHECCHHRVWPEMHTPLRHHNHHHPAGRCTPASKKSLGLNNPKPPSSVHLPSGYTSPKNYYQRGTQNSNNYNHNTSYYDAENWESISDCNSSIISHIDVVPRTQRKKMVPIMETTDYIYEQRAN